MAASASALASAAFWTSSAWSSSAASSSASESFRGSVITCDGSRQHVPAPSSISRLAEPRVE